MTQHASARAARGLYFLNTDAPTLVIVEGPVNAIAIWQAAGWQNNSKQKVNA